MTTLKLKVNMITDKLKMEDATDEDWDEICIIFEKLVRNIKQEYPDLIITRFDKSEKPYVSMKVNINEDSKISDDNLVYIFDYLSGEHTDNPVYLQDVEHLVNSEIIVVENETFLDRFNKIAENVGV